MNALEFHADALKNNSLFNDLQILMKQAVNKGEFSVQMHDSRFTDCNVRTAIIDYLKRSGFKIEYSYNSESLTVFW